MLFKRLPAAVLWDMDGTLVDSEHYWLHSEKQLAKRHDGDWSHEDGMKLIGKSLYDSSQIMKDEIGIDLETHEIIDQLTDAVVEQLRVEIPWRPGARELLRELRERGVKTALVTMSMRRMALEVVEQIDFHAFDVVIAGDDVRNGKPHPEPYLKAAEALGVKAEQCVAFEDSISGLLSAEAAGTRAVAVENFVPIPPQDGRIIWQTLEGVRYRDLRKLFR